MKQSVAAKITIDELKKKYGSELIRAELSLRKILTLDNNDRLIFHEGWSEDYYNHHIMFDSNKQFELLLLTANDKNNYGFSYAIPVVYCNADGTSIEKGKWDGKKIWTLYLIMSRDGKMRVEFVPNRYDWHDNMHPDFKSIGYCKNFISHYQFSEKKTSQVVFDVDMYLDLKNEEKRKQEEKRRSASAEITVGQLEDFLKEFNEMKEKLNSLL